MQVGKLELARASGRFHRGTQIRPDVEWPNKVGARENRETCPSHIRESKLERAVGQIGWTDKYGRIGNGYESLVDRHRNAQNINVRHTIAAGVVRSERETHYAVGGSIQSHP